ncbi:MAG: Lrp/AsnC family transcriptional regulator [Pseudonocardiaceae bacterium]
MADLDSVDWQLLALLQNDASVTNAWLASQVGLAPSSCLERVRRLRRLGVITGIRAVVEPAALGRPLQAMLAVQLRPHSRELVDRFTRAALALPETLALYNVSGPEDYFLHVAVADSRHLQRIIVDHLATRPEVGHCQTHLVFDRPITAPVRPVVERT